MVKIENLIQDLVNIPSPAGWTDKITGYIQSKLKGYGYKFKYSNRGELIVLTDKRHNRAISAHIDTNGGMVQSIMPDGGLRISLVGGFPLNSFEGEYVTIQTINGKQYRGTFLLDNPSSHDNKSINNIVRTLKNMHIRIDEKVKSSKDIEKLGIGIGDYVFFDPRYEYTKSGFVKTRFLDDKASCAVLLYLLINNPTECLKSRTAFIFSGFEEIGIGLNSGLPDDIEELLLLDMGVIGKGHAGTENEVSICAKDSGGPYDIKLRKRLISIAKKLKIPHKVDVFTAYMSDSAAVLRSGRDIRTGLIGPGISASHGVERTHKDALYATAKLTLGYLKNK